MGNLKLWWLQCLNLFLSLPLAPLGPCLSRAAGSHCCQPLSPPTPPPPPQHWNDRSEMQMWSFSSSACIFFFHGLSLFTVPKSQRASFTGSAWSGPALPPCFLLHRATLELCQVTIHCPETPCHLLPPRRSMQVTLSFESSATWPPSLLFHLVRVSPSLSAHLKPHLLFNTFPEPLEQIQSPPLLHCHQTSCTHFSSNCSQRHLCFTYLLLQSCEGWDCSQPSLFLRRPKTMLSSSRNDLSKVTQLEEVRHELAPDKLVSLLAFSPSLRPHIFFTFPHFYFQPREHMSDLNNPNFQLSAFLICSSNRTQLISVLPSLPLSGGPRWTTRNKHNCRFFQREISMQGKWWKHSTFFQNAFISIIEFDPLHIYAFCSLHFTDEPAIRRGQGACPRLHSWS